MPALRLNRPSPATLASLLAVPVLTAAGLVFWQTAPHLSLAAKYATLSLIAYLIGSVSWGYALVNLMRGEDIRDFGSGRTGMSNILRIVGWKAAAAVFALDCGKGVAATLLARYTIGEGAPEAAAALIALCGHNWPVMLGFRGGRGILPGFGGLLMMAPWVAFSGIALFIIVTISSRYLSLGSIAGTVFIAALSLGLTLWGEHHQLYTLYAFAGGAVIIWQHRDNIQRLIRGTERRIGLPGVRK